MKKLFALALALVLALSLTVASADELKVIRVGATAAPHAEILESEAVTAKLAELGYKLEVVVYEGYVLENPAVADGTDDARPGGGARHRGRRNAARGKRHGSRRGRARRMQPPRAGHRRRNGCAPGGVAAGGGEAGRPHPLHHPAAPGGAGRNTDRMGIPHGGAPIY